MLSYKLLNKFDAELLSLYYGIGKYVSENTRSGVWGTDAIKTISEKLKYELNGVRGFSESNIKNMRQFYEEWSPYVNRQPSADDLEKTRLLKISRILSFVDYVIRGYDKPLGVATYRTSKDMPEEMKRALPPVEDPKKLLSENLE